MHRRVATDEFSRGFQSTERDTPTPRRVATDEYHRNDTISRPHGNAGAIVRIHHESGHPRWGSAVADATGTIGGRHDPWVETHGKILLPLRDKHAVATHDQRPRPRIPSHGHGHPKIGIIAYGQSPHRQVGIPPSRSDG
ncbi:hypothetical protein J8C07_10205 [Chloracidobacterium sp. S]|uniref:hypothetical protein n=1 Tax=Chloracidobacterium aggregatum TaxID=2851959 RepID=UPI001B8BC9C4|nr:hypothetical protein [Chloracidobacterium aggregatum]QUV87534.1 hypothetical protein J8C07_10205 [Chloracidobacterium sp. S]